jgi:hypothetical protein
MDVALVDRTHRGDNTSRRSATCWSTERIEVTARPLFRGVISNPWLDRNKQSLLQMMQVI